MTTVTSRPGWRHLAVALLTAAMLTACQSTSPSPSAESSSGVSAPASPSPSSSAAPSSGEVGHWEPAGTMAAAHPQLLAVALADGRALVVGDDTTAELWDPATGEWRTTESLNNPRTNFAAVALADGRVLVTGGLNDISQSYSSAYVFDPRAGAETWTKVGLMDTARTNPSAALLPDGRVLVAGGYFYVQPNYGRAPAPAPDAMLAAYRPDSPTVSPPGGPGVADIAPPNVGAALATAELFDPATGTWSLTSPLNFARSGAAAVTLTDRRILVVGSAGYDGAVTVDGRAYESAEIYDPETGRFRLTGMLPEIDRAAVEALDVPLPDGDPQPANNGTLVALNDGGALLVGHRAWWKHQGEISRSFRFDPQTEEWTEVGQPFAISWDHATEQSYETSGVPGTDDFVAPLPDGDVIVAGVRDLRESPYRTPTPATPSAELYDPRTDTWSSLPPMPEALSGGAAVVLTDGSVLLVDGHLASAIRFVPSP